MVAAAAHAFVSRQKVAGVHDHATGQDLQITAETRGDRLPGFDGDRSSRFGGRLPQLYDGSDDANVSLEIEGATVRGFDQLSKSHYSLTVTDQMVQLYDHAASAWFAFSIQSV